ncbi:MAG TPA: sulfurtransferase TusA family protein [Euryarchaeota archaeon]|nr:sulfurtransferase TusA [archaeon BMS3Bbin15]HDL15862.1 sulfurtransferase TusA family protein [Euryarchaeota archaeon]
MEADEVLDTSGLVCPMPILKTKQSIKKLGAGKVLKVIATDRGSKGDIPAFVRHSKTELLGMEEDDGKYIFFIKKK